MNIHELAAPYAMNALEPREREEFEAHLSGCATCRSEVSDLQAATSRLGAAENAAPPSGLREAVLSGAAAVEQDALPAAVIPIRRRRPSWWPVAAVLGLAAAVVALAFVVVRLDDRVNRMDAMREVMAAPDAAIATLDGDLGFQFYYSMMMDQAVLVSDQVPTVPGDQAYEIWLIDEAAAVSAGLFQPADGAVTVMVKGGLAQARVVEVTIGPEDGSDTPTGDILASAALS